MAIGNDLDVAKCKDNKPDDTNDNKTCENLRAEDEDWLKEEGRVFLSWDGTYRGGRRCYHVTPPGKKHSRARTSFNELPPEFIMPSLPVALPLYDGWRRKGGKRMSIPIMWPHIPGSPTIASVASEWIGKVDIIAGASLMYALSGHSRYVKECFLLERNHDGAVVVMHVPKHKRSDMDSPGHMSESICCPNKQKNKIHFSMGKFKVGKITMATISEVDGFMKDVDRAIEIKTRKKRTVPDLKDTVQASINGSDTLAQFKLSADETTLESVQVYKVSFLRHRHRTSWKNAGERISRMLDTLLSNSLVQTSFGSPVLMTFDAKTRSPIITHSDSKTSMLPM